MSFLRRLGVALALVVAAGCGEINGGEGHFPGTVTFESAGGGYHFHYLSPPWVVGRSSGDVVDMAVPASFAALPASENDVVYRLHIDPLSTDFLKAAIDAAANGRTGIAFFFGQPVVNSDGDIIGTESGWQDRATQLFHRDAYMAAAIPGRSYRLQFTARTKIHEEAMIAQMITSFAPGRAGSAHP